MCDIVLLLSVYYYLRRSGFVAANEDDYNAGHSLHSVQPVREMLQCCCCCCCCSN